MEALWRLRLVLGVELIVAAQAMDLRGGEAAPIVAAAITALREVVATLDEDRPFGRDLERLDAALLENGTLLSRAGMPMLPDQA
jgi:histidine ammonia-lyase